MNRAPIRFDGGIDVNEKTITRVGHPQDGGDAINLSYLVDYIDNLGLAGDSEVIYVSVIDVLPTTTEIPVIKTFKNGVFVEKASTADEDIVVKLRFGKKFSSRVLPDVSYFYSPTIVSDFSGVTWTSLFTIAERNNFDFSNENQTMTNGNITILNNDYIQTFEFNYDVDDFDVGYYYFKNGVDIVEIELDTLDTPLITNAVIVSDYDSGQSELTNGKSYTVEVTSDVNIYEIEIRGSYLTSKNDSSVGGNSTTEEITTTIVNAPNSSDTGDNAYFEVRIKDENGTWSGWYDSELNPNNIEKQEYLVVNNTSPSFGNITIAYSNNPYTALNLYSEDNSEATITISNIDYLGGGGVVGTEIGSSGLIIIKNSNTSFTARAGSAVYMYNTETARLTATRINNGKSTNIDVNINIASSDMVVGDLSINTFRSGPNTGHLTSFSVSSNQRIDSRIVSLAQPIVGLTLENQGTISNTNINNMGIRIEDTSAKTTHSDLLVIELVGLSGRNVIKEYDIISKGFIERTLTNQSLAAPIDIPTVSNITKLLVQVGDAINIESCSYFNSSIPKTPGFDGDIAGQLMEYDAYLDGTWKLIFDDNVYTKAGSGGWLENARIIIEEEI